MLERRFISKNELNDFVGFSMGKINKMMKNKELKYSKIGKSVRFDMDDIKIFDVVIDSDDNLEDRQSSMDLIYKYVGKKVLQSWLVKGDEMELVDKTNSNDVWVWLKNIELLDWDNLKESIYMKEYKDIKDE